MARLTVAAVNTRLNALARLLDDGFLDVYDADGLRLASLRFSTPAFDGAIDGVAKARALASEMDAPNSGTPVAFKLWSADQQTLVLEGKVGEELVLSTDLIQRHAEVHVSEFTLTERP